jgi:dTDP-4-dehydrorhamnose 3,5-epimerase
VRFLPTEIPGPVIVEPKVHGDARGYLLESWNRQTFRENGLDLDFVQDNHSRSDKGVLRGLHFQNPGAQGKLVRVAAGAVWDVAVDVRRSSPHFGQWIGVELSEDNHRMLWVPEGFAHGFVVLRDATHFLYKCTAAYAPEHEQVLAWDDPELAIDWKLDGAEPRLSERDRAGTPLAEIKAFA